MSHRNAQYRFEEISPREDDDRKKRTSRRKENFALLRTSLAFLREKEDSWRIRRIDECERIKEEDKQDILAVVREKKGWYGLKKMSKDETEKMKMRTDERLDISKAKMNMWRKFGQGWKRKMIEVKSVF